jgi:uncharacterized protein (DUF305 family)
MKSIKLKSTALASALLLAFATPAFACGCCGGGAMKSGQKSGGCMGGMMGMGDGKQSKASMCGMGGMSMTQKESDDAMMGDMDHSKMNMSPAPNIETGSTASAGSASSGADAEFAKAMIPHHQGAIEMVSAYLKNGKNPEMRKLAEDILKAQEREIAFLNGWLAGAAK